MEQSLWHLVGQNRFNDLSAADKAYDLIIIGGGFTGCAAALTAANCGAKVALLESKFVGYGGSGRNVGLVNAGLWTPPDQVAQKIGERAGEHLNQILASAPDRVFNLIEKYQIECGHIRKGTLHCAHSRAGVKELENRYQQQKKRHAPVELLNQAEAEKQTGAKSIYGALLDKRAGIINPFSFVQGMARAAQERGAHIFEDALVCDVEYGRNIRVYVNGQWLTSEKLLVATNAYHAKDAHNFPEYDYTPVYYFQAATKPLSSSQVLEILPQRHGCWDTAPVMSSFRLDEKNRLVIGSIGSLKSFGGKIHESWLDRKFMQLFPNLVHPGWEIKWHGRIAMTQDHLPKIIQTNDNVLTITGYSGRGIGPGTVFGERAARYLLDMQADISTLPLAPIQSYQERFNQIKQTYFEFGATITHIVS